jgi:hypothetical protein
VIKFGLILSFQVKPQQVISKYRLYSPAQMTNACLAYKAGRNRENRRCSQKWKLCIYKARRNKGNNKITELRTILQRESQNS